MPVILISNHIAERKKRASESLISEHGIPVTDLICCGVDCSKKKGASVEERSALSTSFEPIKKWRPGFYFPGGFGLSDFPG